MHGNVIDGDSTHANVMDGDRIRLEKGFMQVGAQKVQEEKSSLKERSTNGGVLGEVILCKEEHCTGTMEKRNDKNGGNNADPIAKGRSSNGEIAGKHEKLSVNSEQQVTKDHYEEMDLTEMDYSPARKKPPIHN
ncbi:unnamed protein product [Dovyalis caffra]|uniref:Uncharacterized protein n=1 Tax=Dovyalis caffra TaxID=77055 RepID=A0AAV1RR71_9ROSI|nr:unnamed protein product [Dovyalis caffra]